MFNFNYSWAENDTSKTANITDTIFNKKKVIILSRKSPKCLLLIIENGIS